MHRLILSKHVDRVIGTFAYALGVILALVFVVGFAVSFDWIAEVVR